MKTYFSTFITGFDEVVAHALKQRIKDVQIELLSDGLVIYKTNTSADVVKQLRFFNNTFVLLKQFPKLEKNPVNEMIRQAIRDSRIMPTILSSVPKKKTRFRVMATQENQFVGMDKNLKEKMERIIGQNRNFVVDRAYPDIEFLFVVRREGYGLLGLRLTRHTSYEKILEKGEIYPELAHLLCLISEPHAQDTFLDPFSGSGAIPVARALGFPYKTIYAGDIENTYVNKTKQKAKKVNKKISVSKWNALHLNNFTDNSIDKIVTDPPWGLHVGKELNLEKFYEDMLKEFYRITKTQGMMVILVAKKDLFESVLNNFTDKLKLLKRYDTLVSGQKAGVYKIQKVAKL